MDGIIDFAGIGEFIDAPVKVYSSGMFVRLGFAVAVSLDPEILIVDEVIAVGDEEFQRKCFDHLFELRKRGTTIVLVTHALGLDRGPVRPGGVARSRRRAARSDPRARSSTATCAASTSTRPRPATRRRPDGDAAVPEEPAAAGDRRDPRSAAMETLDGRREPGRRS